jgi:hypothetical protein
VSNIVVLGSGMAGFGAANILHAQGQRAVVYEKSPYYGGHTASFIDKGFLFDLGPHISFTKDERIQKLLASYVDDKYEAVQVKLDNLWHGIRVTHPVQLHLNALPQELIIEVISDFVKEHNAPEPKVANYEEWLIASYGRKFAETFPMTYARKYHTTHAKNMSTDWLGPRMYRPSLQEMLKGALGPWSPDVHYITNFRYPTNGGFISYLKDFPGIADIKTGHEVVAIDPKARQVRFANGFTTGYSALVSSIALPALLPMIAGAPQDVLAAASRLHHVRARECRCEPRRAIRRTDHVHLRRGHCLHAPELPSHAVEDQRSTGVRQHPGRSLLLRQVPSAAAGSRTDHRACHRRPASLRHPAPGGRDSLSRRQGRASCKRDFRPRACRGGKDRAWLSRRHRHQLLRQIR